MVNQLKHPHFSIKGRITVPQGYPLGHFRVAVVSDDWFRDDLIGVGISDAQGEFRLSFTDDEFNQDWGISKAVPKLYIVVSAGFNGQLKGIQQFDFPHLSFEHGHEDLGDLLITEWVDGLPKANDDLDPTPGWSKQVDRLDIDVDLVKDCLVEVTPLVEQLTGWRHLLDDLKIEVVEQAGEYLIKDLADLIDIEADSFAAKIVEKILDHSAAYLGLYDPIRHTMVINKDKMEPHNLDALKVVIGHELVHVGQFKYHPELIEEHKKRFATLKSMFSEQNLNFEELQAKFESLGFQTQMKELEGYAYYIQKDYLEAHYNLATFFEHTSIFESIIRAFMEHTLDKNQVESMTQLKAKQYIEGAQQFREHQGEGVSRFR